MGDHRGPDGGPLHLAEPEGEGVGDVLLFDRNLANEELPRLAVVVGEALRAQARLGAIGRLREAPRATGRTFPGAAFGAPGVGLIIRAALWVVERHVPVLLEVREGAARGVDRQVGEVRAT